MCWGRSGVVLERSESSETVDVSKADILLFLGLLLGLLVEEDLVLLLGLDESFLEEVGVCTQVSPMISRNFERID